MARHKRVKKANQPTFKSYWSNRRDLINRKKKVMKAWNGIIKARLTRIGKLSEYNAAKEKVRKKVMEFNFVHKKERSEGTFGFTKAELDSICGIKKPEDV